MAKLTGAQLVTRLIDLMGWAVGNATDQANAVAAINGAEQGIAQLGSLLHLRVWGTLTQNAAADFAALPAAPPAIDISKQATIAMPSGRKGTLKYLPPELFETRTIDEYGSWRKTVPSSWTWGADSTGVTRVQFDRSNGSGAGITYPFRFQRIPPAIANDGATASTLPEGYELTLLLPWAECHTKRVLGYAGWEAIWKMIHGDEESGDRGRAGRFLDQFRVSKDEAQPDSEKVRAAQLSNLSEGT